MGLDPTRHLMESQADAQNELIGRLADQLGIGRLQVIGLALHLLDATVNKPGSRVVEDDMRMMLARLREHNAGSTPKGK